MITGAKYIQGKKWKMEIPIHPWWWWAPWALISATEFFVSLTIPEHTIQTIPAPHNNSWPYKVKRHSSASWTGYWDPNEGPEMFGTAVMRILWMGVDFLCRQNNCLPTIAFLTSKGTGTYSIRTKPPSTAYLKIILAFGQLLKAAVKPPKLAGQFIQFHANTPI